VKLVKLDGGFRLYFCRRINNPIFILFAEQSGEGCSGFTTFTNACHRSHIPEWMWDRSFGTFNLPRQVLAVPWQLAAQSGCSPSPVTTV